MQMFTSSHLVEEFWEKLKVLVVLDQKSLAQAHRYVLLHSDIISESRREFLIAQRSLNHNIRPTPRIEQRWLVELFPEWLFKQVPVMMERNCSEELIVIARGPNNIVNKYDGFIINSFKFHTKEHEKFRKTQNSGVMVEADGKNYYGALTDIYEQDYYGNFKVVLFRCDWVNINSPRGLRQDINGFTLVNFSRLIHTGVLLKDDPFVFSSQAR
ncbi:uncharacterized protein LOC120105012 [Phoenix dactylifera]|uniref:Uncharacterized protein LOC120105012 n=1 Tax=Phoenix dactylifera TaxID=42345 RepID=A0A8B8ZFR5_PHODC|nr:uncharacterized protein LOC120105012 [Phoenix dactylifera]